MLKYMISWSSVKYSKKSNNWIEELENGSMHNLYCLEKLEYCLLNLIYGNQGYKVFSHWKGLNNGNTEWL